MIYCKVPAKAHGAYIRQVNLWRLTLWIYGKSNTGKNFGGQKMRNIFFRQLKNIMQAIFVVILALLSGWLGFTTLSDEQMLSIGRQHKGFVSEVVFCKEIEQAFEMIYYSSECEVEFCGHGTIACIYDLIMDSPELQSKKEIYLQTRRKGDLIVYNEIATKGAIFISAPKPLYGELNLSVDTICDNMGLSKADISLEYPIDYIDAGNKTLIIPVSSFKKEIGVFPNEETVKEFSLKNDIDVILIFTKETKEQQHYMHTRVFAAKFGYLEDPATGSASCAFGYYMLKHNLWSGESISLEQGGNNRIFNVVKMEMRNGELLFGGAATTQIAGKYFIETSY